MKSESRADTGETEILHTENTDDRNVTAVQKHSLDSLHEEVRLEEANDNYNMKQAQLSSVNGKRKRGRPRRKQSQGGTDKTSVVLKRPGIANKLIKRAMREARKESKAERKRRTPVFMCNLCLNKFSLSGLKEHLKEHCTISGEELRCNLCDKVLTCGNRILNFNAHLR